MNAFVVEPEELTPAWLTEVLGRRVDSVRFERVGTGQIGSCFRLELAGDGVPERLLAKLPAADPGARDMMAGAYRGELRFYRDIAPTVAIRVPAVHHAAFSETNGEFTLLMEDLAPREQGDQIAGCSSDQARDAVVNLAGLHGPRWCDPSLLDLEGLALNGPDDAKMLADLYGPATELFLEGLGELVSAEDAGVLRRCPEVVEQWALGRSERFGLVHGDYRLDNLMFPPDAGPGVVAVDWQTLSLALPARDLAYFLATSLDSDLRREHELDLVAAYHQALTEYGVTGYSLEQCLDDYAFALLQAPLVAVFGCAYGTRTQRGDLMFATMVERACAAMRDHDTLARAIEGDPCPSP
jgi:hypothetical protein